MAEYDKTRTGTEKERIQAERDRLQAIFDAMEDGVYIVGRHYRIEFMNRALRNELGDGVGEQCFDFFGHPRSQCELCLHGMGSFDLEYRQEWFCAQNLKTYEMGIAPLHQPDGSIARLHILRDITERKRMEAELQEYSQDLEAKVARQAEKLRHQERLAVLGEISAGLAHEIRTPLGAIITGIRLLEQEEQEPGEREMIFDLLKKETARLQSKVSEFLAYARSRPLQVQPADVVSLLNDVRALLAADREKLGNVAIRVEVSPGVRRWPMDAEQMREALLNLGNNALRALDGEGELVFGARLQKNELEITVRDTGPGIPPDVLPHIFKPFYTRAPEGTGLGLSISQRIVESHGGRILALSATGRYTLFRVFLPPQDMTGFEG
jgi:signal transduction histidine kinase